MTPKRRDKCLVLLDDCFDSQSCHEAVCALGFIAERFTKFFPDKHDPVKRQAKIKDNRVIDLCQRHGFLLLTTDREMRKTFIEELKRSDIGVVATANNEDGTAVWIQALKEGKAKILRDFKKWQRPYFSILQKSGIVNTQTLTGEMTTRRTRPRERDQSVATSSRVMESANYSI